MRKLTATGCWLALGALGLVPATSVAQNQQAGQDNTGFGTTSAEFLLLGAGARGAALGGAFSAIASDVSALYYNPAGAALMERPSLMVGTYDYLAGTRYSWGGVAFPFSGGSRTIGLQLGTFGFKDQPIYTEDQPNGTGSTYSVSETFVGLTLAQQFSDRFSAGITGKYINDRLGTVSGNAFAMDFGTNFHASLNNHPIKFSFTLANLGSNINYQGTGVQDGVPRTPIDDPNGDVPTLPDQANLRTKDFGLPTTFRVGLAYDLLTGDNNRFTVLGDFNQPNSNTPGFVFGSEWMSQRLGGSNFGFALRGSYSYTGANNVSPSATSPTALNDEENLQGLAFGGGLMYGLGSESGFNLSLDYAYKYLGILGPTNFFSFTLGW
jgi:hypothetical protein